MKSYYLRIADFQVRVNIVHVDNDQFQIPPQYWPFALVDGPNPEEPILFTLTINNRCKFPPYGKEIGQFNATGNNQAVWQQARGGYIFELSDQKGAVVCRMRSTARFKSNTVALYGDLSQLIFGFNNAMMIAFSFSSARHSTLLMHASVTLYKERGFLFLGKSGTGKSTHSSLWLRYIPHTSLLNDDNPVVRVVRNRVIVYGTPWSGKTPCYINHSAPADAFVMLQQSPHNAIQRANPVHAFAYLLASCSSMIWDSPTYHAILRTINRVISRVSVYHLECLPDTDAARLSQSTITCESHDDTPR